MDLWQALALVEGALKDRLRLDDEGFTIETVSPSTIVVDLDRGWTIRVDVDAYEHEPA